MNSNQSQTPDLPGQKDILTDQQLKNKPVGESIQKLAEVTGGIQGMDADNKLMLEYLNYVNVFEKYLYF